MLYREIDFTQFGPNAAFIRELYDAYLKAPELVGEPWVSFFRELMPACGSEEQSSSTPPTSGAVSLEVVKKQAGVSRLIDAFRSYGHFEAKVNPLSQGVATNPEHDELDLSSFGLNERDLDSPYFTDGLLSEGTATLSEILGKLKDVYCGSIGAEFMHLTKKEERGFLLKKFESRDSNALSTEEKRDVLKRLIESEAFESSLHKRYVGQKRFSLEGAETVIPMLSALCSQAALNGGEKVIIGMPHRGRLNTLLHIAGKPLERIFCEFEDRTAATEFGSGDVKYHLGWESDFHCLDGSTIRVALAPNPSHLEFVNPVVEGMVRAIQDRSYGTDRTKVVPVLLHGEAAFAGQGIVYETLNFAGTAGYDTGGTIHLIVNNQIGFTAISTEQRGTIYCSDLGRGIDAPVFHLNAEDPESCVWAMKCAVEFRQKFGRDVIIDLFCHRKYGHNEGDDPTFTQPLMYREIKAKELLSKQYQKSLDETLFKEYDLIHQSFLDRFEEASERSKSLEFKRAELVADRCVPNRITAEALGYVASASTTVPQGFVAHPKLIKLLEKRAANVSTGESVEWGVAEALAFGSLLLDGVSIRLSGQDCGRGTFSHRNAVLYDYEGQGSCIPLNSLVSDKEGAYLEVLNSVLSEAGVMGFEFGYSHEASDMLILWEGQFGDFANGAQVIIDQFLAGSEVKWGYRSGLVLLLPHGYEGQGPEHSSARLERYLQLCAEGNMSVCYPSNSAQYFHLLRAQGLSKIKRPLIVMTPKSLLRLPDASSKLSDFTDFGWRDLICEDIGSVKSDSPTVLLSGKVYYDVVSALRRESRAARVIRLEKLYPTPLEEIVENLTDGELLWVQEEPKNMGGWSFIQEALLETINRRIRYIGRERSASTAAGSGKRHSFELNRFLSELIKACG